MRAVSSVPAPDPEGTYRIIGVYPLPGIGGAVSVYTDLRLARYNGGGGWESRTVSRLTPEKLLVYGDTPRTSGRFLFNLTKEELKAIRVRLLERAGRVADIVYSAGPGGDTTNEAELPDFLRVTRGLGDHCVSMAGRWDFWTPVADPDVEWPGDEWPPSPWQPDSPDPGNAAE